jgi:hypothetical protein
LNKERLKLLRERYKQLESIGEPAFFYGSHYSSPGVVLFYLMRLEPYTSYMITMQGGSFDREAVRMFWSVADIWMGVNNNSSDVKELVCPNVI